MEENVISSCERRIFAFLIDHLMFSFISAFACFFSLGSNWDQSAEEMMGKMWYVILVVLFIYVLKDSVAGMSPGRLIMGIAVRSYSAPRNNPGIFRLALRNLLLFIWPVEFFVLVFSKQKRRLGDFIAGTTVVKRNDISTWKRALVSALLVSVFVIFFVAGISVITKNSSAYKSAVAYIEASSEIDAEVGKIVSYGFFPMGGIHVENQYGHAQLKIKIKGENNTVFAMLKMEKKPGSDWQVTEMTLKK